MFESLSDRSLVAKTEMMMVAMLPQLASQSSEVIGLCFMKYPSETLQCQPYSFIFIFYYFIFSPYEKYPGLVFIFQKQAISQDHFIQHKPRICEQCSLKLPCATEAVIFIKTKGRENKTPAINFNKLKIVLEKVKICASFKKSHTELHAVSVKQYFVLNYTLRCRQVMLFHETLLTIALYH